MRVEPYSDAYLHDVVRLVKDFHQEVLSGFDEVFSVEAVIDLIKRESETNGDNAYLLIENGICWGILFGLPIKSRLNDKMMFQEIIWYVDKAHRRHGIKLLKEAEKDLKLRGFSIMLMAVMENSMTDKIKRFYKKLGFRPMETSYIRTL